MPVHLEQYQQIAAYCKQHNATLVAVSKTKPEADILALYQAGHRHFGENYVQEMVAKAGALPSDIYWHFIGHLQSNKVKYIAPFVHLIHGVDSLKLLQEINKQAAKANRTIACLLQVHIAMEETKFGLSAAELEELLQNPVIAGLTNLTINGLMGMASFTNNQNQVQAEFNQLHSLFTHCKELKLPPNVALATLSMGMSADYELAIACGSNMVRVGSLLFGSRH